MKKGYICVAVATLMFSSMEVMLKFIVGELNVIQLSLIRFTLGGLCLLPMALNTLKKRGEHLGKKDLAYLTLLGFVGITVSMPVYQLAVFYAGASTVSVLYSCNPIFTAVLAVFMLKEMMRKNHIAALILQLLGSLIIINPFDTKIDPTGLALIIAATLLFSLYSVMGKHSCAKFGGVVVTCFGFLSGSVFLLLIILLTRVSAVADLLTQAGLGSFASIPILDGITLANLPYVLYVSLGVAGVGFCAYFLAMEYLSASEASLVYFFKPALAPFLAWLVHGEWISVNMMVGIVCILIGALVSTLPGIVEAKKLKKQEET